MKFIYYFIFIFFFMGCSSLYTLKNFPSKQKFYDDYNSFAKNKKVDVTLTNDSSFTTSEGTRISNDSLILINQIKKTEVERIPKRQIKSINDFYDSNSNHMVKIFLQDGKEIDEKHIKYLPDSSIQIVTTRVITTHKSLPLDIVKEVYYKNNWPGIIPGLILGIPAGIIISLSKIIPTYVNEGSPPRTTYDYIGSFIIGIPSGSIIGCIIGYLIGFNYTYQFNP